MHRFAYTVLAFLFGFWICEFIISLCIGEEKKMPLE